MEGMVWLERQPPRETRWNLALSILRWPQKLVNVDLEKVEEGEEEDRDGEPLYFPEQIGKISFTPLRV